MILDLLFCVISSDPHQLLFPELGHLLKERKRRLLLKKMKKKKTKKRVQKVGARMKKQKRKRKRNRKASLTQRPQVESTLLLEILWLNKWETSHLK